MAITDSIKKTYNKIKSSIKESIFSKNKSIIRFSEFNKKNIIEKIGLTTFINMFFTLPFAIFYSTPDLNGLERAFQAISFYFFVFLFSNTVVFSGMKFISYLFKKYTNKFHPKFQPAFTVKEDELKPEYFEGGFINKIKEFFIAVSSIAASFLPFIMIASMALIIAPFFNGGYYSFGDLISLLELDGIMLIVLTTLASSSIYSIKGLLHLKDKLISLLSKKDKKEPENKEENSPYIPKRSFPVDEFAVSLHQDFKKSNDINAYEELKVMTKEIPEKSKE